MPAKAYKKTAATAPIEKEATVAEQQSQDLELFDSENKSLEVEASKKLPFKVFQALKRIAYYVGRVGLSLEESCLLADIDFEKFKHYMVQEPIVNKIILMKQLMYKKDMMIVLSASARGGDDKLALTILERRYPEEFGSRKPPKDNEAGDLFNQAILLIRNKRDSLPLVDPSSGESVVYTRNSASEGKIERIGDIIPNTIRTNFKESIANIINTSSASS